MFSCSDDDVSKGALVASFTATSTPENPNLFFLDNTTPGAENYTSHWQFAANGTTLPDTDGLEEAFFASEGSYVITLTVVSADQTATASQTVTVGATVYSFCNDANAVLLANTCANSATGKTWVWSTIAGAYGVGPTSSGIYDSADTMDLSWYSHPENGFTEPDGSSCVYDDKYVFKQDENLTYQNLNNNTYQWGWAWANLELGLNLPQFADGCYESPEPDTSGWILTYKTSTNGNQYPWLMLTNGATIAYYEGTSEYQIVSITEDVMILRNIAKDPNGPQNGWRYYRLVREGYADVGNTSTEPDTPLKSAATTFSVGMAVQSNRLTGNHNDILTREFNNLTAEYEMKMNITYPSQGNYDFTAADAIVNYGVANNMDIHGHALIWYQSVPSWVTNFSGTDAEFESMIEDYITTVVQRYSGQVRSWDVVNEAVEDSNGYGLRNSIFKQRMGDNYIQKCYQFARNADPNVLLFYNDYNISFDTGKLAATMALVDNLMASNLIDGVGAQMHISYNFPSATQIQNMVDQVVSRGLKLHFSELDVRANPNNDITSLTEARAIQQQNKVKEVVQIYNAIPQANKFAITVWGLRDNETWLIDFWGNPEWPLLYDSGFNIKKAHTGFLEGLD